MNYFIKPLLTAVFVASLALCPLSAQAGLDDDGVIADSIFFKQVTHYVPGGPSGYHESSRDYTIGFDGQMLVSKTFDTSTTYGAFVAAASTRDDLIAVCNKVQVMTGNPLRPNINSKVLLDYHPSLSIPNSGSSSVTPC